MFDPRNPEHFAMLLLVHLASADGSLHPAEEDVILKEGTSLFNSHDVASLLASTREHWTRLGMVNAMAEIDENLLLLGSLNEAQRNRLYSLLFDVINADGRVREEETTFLKKVKFHLLS
ncbi:MAG: TerB family tellurite resistance protein [Bacteroidetes bacterium]|nr:TerB family tellurite resistance protein [Bacteroidota bacterium]